ncbi:MAG TPA: 30S ribosomal protein S3 [Armatimonadota bacterium]|jgi:small subunit ribosomal protein S3
MGQKVNPIGFRVGINKDHLSKWYANNKNYADLLEEDLKLRGWLKSKLYQAGIARIEIERFAGKMKVNIHTAKPGIIIGRGGKGIDDLRADVERFINKPGMTTINVVEIRVPEMEAQLVAESIAQQIEKRIAYKRAMRQSMQRTMKIGAKGMKIICSGRLAGSEMARVECNKDGKIPLHTIRADIDYGFCEALTTYGHIGIKVWIYKGDILDKQRAGSRPESGFDHAGRDRDRGPRRERVNERGERRRVRVVNAQEG